MRKLILVIPILSFALSMSAQITSVTGIDAKDGSGLYALTNNSDSPVIAWQVSKHCLGLDSNDRVSNVTDTSLNDSLFHFGHDRPLMAHGTALLHFPASNSKCPAKIEAAIFADGHAEGSKDVIDLFYHRRVGIDMGIDFAQNVLQQLLNGSIQTDEVIKTLEQKAIQVSTDPPDPVIVRGEVFVIREVSYLLQKQIDLHVPSLEGPNRRPSITALVKQGVPKSTAVETAVSKDLIEWKEALAGNLVPPTTFPQRLKSR